MKWFQWTFFEPFWFLVKPFFDRAIGYYVIQVTNSNLPISKLHPPLNTYMGLFSGRKYDPQSVFSYFFFLKINCTGSANMKCYFLSVWIHIVLHNASYVCTKCTARPPTIWRSRVQRMGIEGFEEMPALQWPDLNFPGCHWSKRHECGNSEIECFLQGRNSASHSNSKHPTLPKLLISFGIVDGLVVKV